MPCFVNYVTKKNYIFNIYAYREIPISSTKYKNLTRLQFKVFVIFSIEKFPILQL